MCWLLSLQAREQTSVILKKNMIQCDRRISEILGEAKLLEGGDDDDDLDGEPEDNGGMRKRPKKSKRKKPDDTAATTTDRDGPSATKVTRKDELPSES